MMETWALLILLSTGEIMPVQMPTELACDRERAAIEQHEAADSDCPMAVAAQCVIATFTPEALQ